MADLEFWQVTVSLLNSYDNNTVLIVLAPHMNTAAGKETELNKNGLRGGHEGKASEHVRFLRFADEGKDEHNIVIPPLAYRYEDHEGGVQERRFGIGNQFLSVDASTNSGLRHVIENDSDRPIMLLITVVPKPVNLRQ